MAKSKVAGSVTRAGKPLAFGLVPAAALVAVMLVLVATKPAGAAFPESNGQIVFYSADSIAVGDPSSSDTEIFSMNPNGTGLTQLTVNSVQDFNPAWSPGGTEIVFESRRDNPNGEIYKMPANGSPNPRRLTNNAASDFDPAWSPGGTRIVFVSDRNANGDSEIYTMSSSNGANVVRLTKNLENDLSPAWSPNGKKIAFTSFRTGNYEIYTMKPVLKGRTNRPVNLSKNATAHDDAPNWSPDGTKIAFQSDRDANGEIYVMDAIGTGQTRRTITGVPANENNPDWQPGP